MILLLLGGGSTHCKQNMWDGMCWCSHHWKMQFKGVFYHKSAGYNGVNKGTKRSPLSPEEHTIYWWQGTGWVYVCVGGWVGRKSHVQ